MARRNSEKRKEKSRFAARFRRSQESEIFNQIGQCLPLAAKTVAQMDKASVVRIAINYLKIRQFVDSLKDIMLLDSAKSANKLADDRHSMSALDGFMLILSKEGDMIYISENVVKYLGLSQTELLGHSIFDYCHPCDHSEIKDMLSLKSTESPLPINSVNNHSRDSNSKMLGKISCSFFVRMKCTLTNKGRNVNLKSASYKVIHYSGSVLGLNLNEPDFKQKNTFSQLQLPASADSSHSSYCMVSYGEPMEHPCAIEKPLDQFTFITRHSLDMKFTHVDEKISQFLGYDHQDLIGQSLYRYFHALDLVHLEGFFKTLLEKGQCETEYYRFLAKCGGHVWILTRATIIGENNSQAVVCINHVLSHIENEFEVVSEYQKPPVKSSEPLLCMPDEVFLPPQQENYSPTFSSTKTIFAPRTADMENGFLMFTDDSGLTILPDNEADPIDLTHLAPQAGDVCVPLDVSGMLDIFDEMLLDQNANANQLLAEEDKSMKIQSDSIFLNENGIQQHSSTSNDMYKKMMNDDLMNVKVNHFNVKDTLNEEIQNILNNSGRIKEINVIDSFGGHSPLNNDPFLSYQEDLFSVSPSSVSSSDAYSSSKSNSPTNLSPIINDNNTMKGSTSWDVSKLTLEPSGSSLEEEMLNQDFSMRAPYISMDDYPLLLNDDLSCSSTNIDDLLNSDSAKSIFGTTNNNMQNKVGENYDLTTSSNLALLLQTDLSRRTLVGDCGKKNFQQQMKMSAPLANTGMKGQNAFPCINFYNNLISEDISTKNGVQLQNMSGLPKPNNLPGPFSGKMNQKSNQQLAFQNNYSNLIATQVNDGRLKTTKISTVNQNTNVPIPNWSNKSAFDSPSNFLKRPLPNESFEASVSVIYNKIGQNADSNAVGKTNGTTKRMKSNIPQQLKNSGTSVLMNLLVNGEDATNGYSKYSSLNHSSIQRPNNNNLLDGNQLMRSKPLKPPLLNNPSNVR